MKRILTLLPFLVIISSSNIMAEGQGLLLIDSSPQLHRVLSEQTTSFTTSETTSPIQDSNPCQLAQRNENSCNRLFRQESSSKLLQPLVLLLMALGLIGLGIASRIK
jgi:hypothetical protein